MSEQRRDNLVRSGDVSPKRSKGRVLSAKSDHVADTILDFDPDLMLEVDLPLNNTDRTTQSLANSFKSGLSTSRSGSRKVMSAGKVGHNGNRSAPLLKTRARPIKPHEPEPFLSVDNISSDKLIQEILTERETKSAGKDGSQKEKRTKTPTISTNQNYSFWAGSRSPYSSPLPPRKSSRKTYSVSGEERWSSSRSGCRTPGSAIFVSPNQGPQKTNHHVKSPFKHAVKTNENENDATERSKTPATEIKERTAVATYYIGKVLSKEKMEQQRKSQGRLLKGKLKPLKPVAVDGPTIDKCRGILSETRSYGPPPNRTLARRRELIQKIPNVHEYLYERPRTVESIHRTSEASSVDENREIKDVDEMPLDISRLSPVDSDVNMPNAPPASVRTSYKVVDGFEGLTPTRNLTELQSSSTRENFLKKDQTDLNENSSQKLETDNTLVTTMEGSIERPDTAGERSKFVRFADGSSPDKMAKTETESVMKAMEVDVSMQNKKEKVKSKSSCKTSEIEMKKDQDDDPDDSHNPKKNTDRKIQTFQTVSSKNSNDTRDANKENRGKQNSSVTEGDLMIQMTQLLSSSIQPQEQENRPHSNTKYTLISSQENSTPNMLNIQTVIHGNTIQHLIGPESPHRSRSPSPSRSPKREKILQKSKPDKTNKLIRPSSANQDTRKSRRFSSNSQESSETFTARKSKVYFEGEKQPRQSLFVERETENGVSVDLKEDRLLSFDEIEAELIALQEDIEERHQFENMNRISVDDYDANDFDDGINLDIISLPSENQTDNEIESAHGDNNTELSDYSRLLDIYRKKCMEVSENCGAISEVLTTPRGKGSSNRPHSGTGDRNQRCSRKPYLLSRRNSYHFENSDEFLGRRRDSNTSYFKHTLSDVSIADSGYSRSSSEVTDMMNSSADTVKENMVSKPTLQQEEASDLCLSESERIVLDDKTLLEIVCDELPNVQKVSEGTDSKTKKEPSELEIIAKQKEIQKSKHNRKDREKVAPFAPLCFTINARPPEGFIYYFAYGADMNPSRISTYIQRTVEHRFWGLLYGFTLVFNKKGADMEAGGFANIEFNPFCSTEGCLYQITPKELELLDKFVGYPKHYEHLMLPVWMMNSTDNEKYGIAQYCVPAVMYIAQPEWIAQDNEELNCDYALTQCIKSSDLVTPNYREFLINKAGPIGIQG